MISVDANILLYSYCEASPFHSVAKNFIQSLANKEDVALSEFVLSEFYLHLRNPAVLDSPLTPLNAVEVIESFRQHPLWQVLGFPPHSQSLHKKLWKAAASQNFARRRIYDLRIALCLQAFGVTEFATANVKDFEDTGFSKVWNPLA